MIDEYLSIKEQITYLKNRNMRFTSISQTQAIHILTHETYYHKVISYKSYFSNYTCTYEKENFHNIEFKDLYELYLIDLDLKELLNDICLQVEQYYKVFLVRYADNLPHQKSHYYYYDVFDIEKRYRVNAKMQKRVKDFNDGYSKKMLKKFPDKKPIWVLNEFLSFGEVIEIFVKYCKLKNLKKYDFLLDMLMQTKSLRNTTVHGNKLFTTYTEKNIDIYGLKINFKKTFGIDLSELDINDYFKYNIISTLYCYKMLAPEEIFIEKCNLLFMSLHNIIKNNEIFKKYPTQKVVIDILRLYKLLNKLY